MNKYYFLFLIWLLPAYFLFQGGYQLLVYNGLNSTYENGESYVADVIDFDVKQIAAQTNGYVVLRFELQDGERVEERLALPVQMAQVIMESELIPVRYSSNSFNPIVMLPTYELQKSVVSVNMAVSFISLIAVLIVAFFVTRFALRRIRDGEEKIEIEQIDAETAIA
ncbi:hypothetical protein DYD21_06665 [Rhodohalobacter sp. SW132]|uniref:hypothetical protein n=1 Tax=Rhodohalobacter sp. SW132 TaxID=2293433 RepID=UPI000E2659DF|nr:hypothetical protein [Rhodohalobacter sp. SW132]REL38284.1 hypothetical protein DYD21_06665 [Rhodohalobacter sp. SW132]